MSSKKTTSDIEVDGFHMEPLKIKDKAFLKMMYNIDDIPVFSTAVKFNIKGDRLNFAVINSLRRVLTDELLSYHLSAKDAVFDHDDPYQNLPQFEQQLSQIPLCYCIPKNIIKDLTFNLNIENHETSNKVVLSGFLTPHGAALTYPIFNPTFKLCTLSSGKKISVTGIKIVQNYGKYYSGANVTSNAIHRCLDIEEYSLEEMNREENRLKSFSHESGYKESSLVANPKHFELSFNVRATTSKFTEEINQILSDTCNNIISRLRNILMYISKEFIDKEDNIQSSIESQDEGEINRYVITIPNETHTIGNLIIKKQTVLS